MNFEEFPDWRHQREERTLGAAFEELRSICEEEDYSLEIPPRKGRPNPFPEALDELSG